MFWFFYFCENVVNFFTCELSGMVKAKFEYALPSTDPQLHRIWSKHNAYLIGLNWAFNRQCKLKKKNLRQLHDIEIVLSFE